MQVRKSCSTCKISKKKFFLGDAITTKWQNIRDAFVRSLKKKSGQAVQRKYVYHDQLQFLLKVLNKGGPYFRQLFSRPTLHACDMTVDEYAKIGSKSTKRLGYTKRLSSMHNTLHPANEQTVDIVIGI